MIQKFISKQLARPSGLFGRFVTTRWLEKANSGMNDLTLESLALKADDEVIEVGFGSGYLLERILTAKACKFAVGIEPSNEMVMHVRRRLQKYIESGKADIRNGNIESIPYPDAVFSKLCSVNTLYFWTDPATALSECRRVLKPGGLIALCFNSKADLTAWPGHVHGFKLYELSEIKEMLGGAGFCQVEAVSRTDPEQGLFYCVTGIAE